MKIIASLLIVCTLSFDFASGIHLPRNKPSTQTVIPNRHYHAKGEGVLKDVAPGQSQPAVPPEDVVHDFYQSYLHMLYQSPNADPFKEYKNFFVRYVTARLLQELANSRRTSTVRTGPDVDTEYFFQTLDLDSDWEKNITVSKPSMKVSTAVVHVTLSGHDDSRADLKVVLKQESGLWKIDDAGLWRQ